MPNDIPETLKDGAVWYLISKYLPKKVKIRIEPINEYEADAAGPDM